MAICRCLECGKPIGRGAKGPYLGYVKPIGYPTTALICGQRACNNPGLIWVKQHDLNILQSGQTVLEGETNVAKMEYNPSVPYQPVP